MGRTLIAGVLGAVAMFVASALLHLSPLANVGIKDAPSLVQAVLVGELANQGGLYGYPEKGVAAKDYPTRAQGLISYIPAGRPFVSPVQLAAQFVVQLVECLICAALLSLTAIQGYWRRVGFVAAIGLVAAVATNATNGIFLGFSGAYTVAMTAIELIGFVAAGLVLARVMREPSSRA